MARTRKSIQPLNLYKYDVLIEDRGVRSDYFKISQFDGYFYGGRNAFLVAGSGVLKPNSKILVELLNRNGSTIYSAPVANFVEGNSRLVQVEVYNDTPIGAGKLVLLGCVDTLLDGSPVPPEWKNKYNVRWITDVVISPFVENKTPIRFVNPPSMTVNEKFYFAPSSSVFTEKILVPVSANLTPKYYNVYPTGYIMKMSGSSENTLNNLYLNGIITGSVYFEYNSEPSTASINIPISRIYNSNVAESDGVLIYSNKRQLILGTSLSSTGAGSVNIDQIGRVTATGSLNIQYSKLESINTGSVISFAKIRIVDLKTHSGEINKIRLSYKPETEPGEYVLLGDIQTNVQELLTVDSGSEIVNIGKFSDVKVSDYWYSETMSLQKNERFPVLPNYYFSSSISVGSVALQKTSKNLLDAIQVQMPIDVDKFFNTSSYFIGTKSSNTFQLFPNSEYTLAFKAVVTKQSASVILNQSNYTLEVYLVKDENSSNVKFLEKDIRGQLIGTISPIQTAGIQNFENVEFNFFPKIQQTSNFGLRFVVYGGFWNIADVSLKTAQEPYFSTDEVDILIPNINYKDKILSFKAQYLDVNNNSIGLNTLSVPTYFTGSTV
jgi:hypothetical protein